MHPSKVCESLNLIRKNLNKSNLRMAWLYAKCGNIRHLIQALSCFLAKITANTEEFLFLEDLLKLTNGADKKSWAQFRDCVDVIVPVFNQYECANRLFDSLLKNTRPPYRLIIVDDHSTDRAVVRLVNELVGKSTHILLLRNETNYGFVRSINRAYEYVQNNFVILNTDVEVPPNWLERLMYPIWREDAIASTTPFTNAGTICSFPQFLEDNPTFEDLPVAVIDEYFQCVGDEEEYIRLPSGVGFCMGFSKKVVEEIGLFDEETFGKGYGEENDWSMKAHKRGYRNVIVPNLYVWHKHGGSFGKEEKSKLMERNYAKLEEKHPEYRLLVSDFIAKDPLRAYRELLVFLITANSKGPLTLMIDHNLGGGANEYRNAVVKEVVDSGGKVLLVVFDFDRKEYKASYCHRKYNLHFRLRSVGCLEILLYRYVKKVDGVVLNDLVSFKEPLETLGFIEKVKRRHKAAVKVAVHDYFCICPNYVLLNERYEYCGVPGELERCLECLRGNRGEFQIFVGSGKLDIRKWRRKWGEFLGGAEEIVCFSYSSKTILREAYPFLDEKQISVKPHRVDYVSPVERDGRSSETVRIGIIGSINRHKGAGIVKQIADIAKEQKAVRVELVIIGEITEKMGRKNVVVTGKYKKENLPSLVREYAIDVVLIPSICPETFSYVTEEAIKMNLPVAAFDIGAPGERIRNYDKGLIIRKMDARTALEDILSWRALGRI